MEARQADRGTRAAGSDVKTPPPRDPAMPPPIVDGPAWLQDMFEDFITLRRMHGVMLAWQMGDWFEFYLDDAVTVARILGVALTTRGKRPNGKPVHMCAVPADHRFTVRDGCLLVPLDPTDHDFGRIVQAGQPLAVAVHVDLPITTAKRQIAAVFYPEDFPGRAGAGVVTLVGKKAVLRVVGEE